MSNERIDLAEIENMRLRTEVKVGMFWDLIAELKRVYADLDHAKKIIGAFYDEVGTHDVCMNCYKTFDTTKEIPDDHEWLPGINDGHLGITCNKASE